MTPPARCPGCNGLRLTPHPRFDPLRYAHDQTCWLLASEDARRAADHDLVPIGWEPRAVTITESALLSTLGVVATPSTCVVTRESAGVLRRSFLDEHGRSIDLDPKEVAAS